jgi:pyrrolidone-carboxylate peptidase
VERPLVVVTGFGAFPGVLRNPSREIARALERDPPSSMRVRAFELPVTFQGVGPAIDASLSALGSERPSALFGLGVQTSGASFRLESRARGRLSTARLDAEGHTSAELAVDAGPDLETELDLAPFELALREAGAPIVERSRDAGAYVCERTYHHLLLRARELAVPALFLHLPPIEVMDVERQIPIVRAAVERLAD